MKTKALLIILLALNMQTIIAQEFSVGPTDDAHFFFHASKTENYGSEPLLRSRFSTSGEFRTDIALKFDISGCTFELPYERVLLKLYGTDDGVICPIRVLKFEHTYANYDWTESVINGAKRPGTNYAADSIAQLNFEGNYEEKFHQWDITEWVNAEKTAGRNIINLHVRQMSMPGSTFNDPIFFHSKENESGKKPLILIEKVQSGLIEINTSSDWAFVSNGKLVIKDSELSNMDIAVYSLSGNLIRIFRAENEFILTSDIKGLKVIKAGNRAMKIMF